MKLDSGGLAKGLFADALAEALSAHDSFAINCAGDVAIGGCSRAARQVHVQSPFDAERPAHLRGGSRRRRHERHRPAKLARRRRAPGAPPAGPGHGTPGVHRPSRRCPFVPRQSTSAGVVTSAPPRAHGVAAGDRVAAVPACTAAGGPDVVGLGARRSVTFPLPDSSSSFAQGAAHPAQLPHRATSPLVACAGGLQRGRDRARPRRPPAASARRPSRSPRGTAPAPSVWSPPRRRQRWPRRAGADEVVVVGDGSEKDEVKQPLRRRGRGRGRRSPVGGDRFTDSLRALREGVDA